MNLNDLHNLMDDLAHDKGASQSDLEAREEEFRAAFDAHPEWTEQMRQRDAFDVKLCKVMPQVEIPAGLKERLLTAFDKPQVSARPASETERPDLRRRIFGTITVLLTVVLVVFAIRMIPRTPSLTVADVEQELPKLWDASDANAPDATPDQSILPSGGWHSNQLRFPRGWKTHEVAGESLAFRKFEFLSDRGLLHTGLIASLPLSSLSKAPNLTDPFSDNPTYKPIGDGSNLAIIIWTDPQTKRVYFLAVPAADHTLKALKELLEIPLA